VHSGARALAHADGHPRLETQHPVTAEFRAADGQQRPALVFDQHLVARANRLVGGPDELREDVAAVADVRFALVADDDPVRGCVECRYEVAAAGDTEAEPTVGAVSRQSVLAGVNLAGAAPNW